MPPRTTQNDRAETISQMLSLKAQGLTYKKIGQMFGYSVSGVKKVFNPPKSISLIVPEELWYKKFGDGEPLHAMSCACLDVRFDKQQCTTDAADGTSVGCMSKEELTTHTLVLTNNVYNDRRSLNRKFDDKEFSPKFNGFILVEGKNIRELMKSQLDAPDIEGLMHERLTTVLEQEPFQKKFQCIFQSSSTVPKGDKKRKQAKLCELFETADAAVDKATQQFKRCREKETVAKKTARTLLSDKQADKDLLQRVFGHMCATFQVVQKVRNGSCAPYDIC